jgi:hypothetical protein
MTLPSPQPIRSRLATRDVELGQTYWHCRRWYRDDDDFVSVRVVERRGNRLAVQHEDALEGEREAEIFSVTASSLWPESAIEYARERRARDLAIQRLDQERPVDAATSLAIELCCDLASGDIALDRGVIQGVLRRLGRADDLEQLHPLAYTENNHEQAQVYAPVEAIRQLFQDFAAAEPTLVDERAAEVVAAYTWVSERLQTTALAIVRRWAKLPTVAGATDDGAPDEVSRLRAIVELAAEALDEAGRADQAQRIRRAAFPHRFR